jgi:hypothetical protein
VRGGRTSASTRASGSYARSAGGRATARSSVSGSNFKGVRVGEHLPAPEHQEHMQGVRPSPCRPARRSTRECPRKLKLLRVRMSEDPAWRQQQLGHAACDALSTRKHIANVSTRLKVYSGRLFVVSARTTKDHHHVESHYSSTITSKCKPHH